MLIKIFAIPATLFGEKELNGDRKVSDRNEILVKSRLQQDERIPPTVVSLVKHENPPSGIHSCHYLHKHSASHLPLLVAHAKRKLPASAEKARLANANIRRLENDEARVVVS